MPIDFSRVRAICFDVDGTLSDTDDLWVNNIHRLLQPVRFIFPQRDPRPFSRRLIMSFETPMNLVYHWLDHLDLDDNAIRMTAFASRISMRQKAARTWIIPRVSETLLALHARFPLAVVSARDEHGTLNFLSQHNLHDYFKAIATSQTCRYTKPFPDPILWAAEKMDVSPTQCLMVGDTTVDIRAGKAAGAQTVGVLCGFGSETELRRAGADLIVASPVELLNII